MSLHKEKTQVSADSGNAENHVKQTEAPIPTPIEKKNRGRPPKQK